MEIMSTAQWSRQPANIILQNIIYRAFKSKQQQPNNNNNVPSFFLLQSAIKLPTVTKF